VSLSASEKHHLDAAEGWLDLDDPVEAGKELDQIGVPNSIHPQVLLRRCRVYLAIHRPEYTRAIATTLTEQLPESADAWFYLACACSRLGQNDVAASALKKCFLAAERTAAENDWQEALWQRRILRRFGVRIRSDLTASKCAIPRKGLSIGGITRQKLGCRDGDRRPL
jgi:predicted Zn-dependent protease